MLGIGSDISSLIHSLNEDQRERLKVLLSEFGKENVKFTVSGYSHSREVTMDNLIEDIDNTTAFEKRRKAATEAASKCETTIPKNRWGVHETHCCEDHGCKYGEEDCPVVVGLVKQAYRCEACDDE